MTQINVLDNLKGSLKLPFFIGHQNSISNFPLSTHRINPLKVIESTAHLEKIVLVNNLLNIAWLSRGLELSRAVARIVTPEGLGTGFLISSDLLLTNNHVLPNSALAGDSRVEFNYQKDWSGQLEPVQTFTWGTATIRVKNSHKTVFPIIGAIKQKRTTNLWLL
ncbi:trypsin-like serine peptidase [Desulfosporosinus nitroreducens]|uniref:Serine protease n=1 Tax=Desulfosporosinus nitroreducens TaxID=2018668 RepID=A0ABT8QZH3_9FIRM|nr:hypothetical protein [Desulfosporosinus nitroreducens]MDO0826035.1 serine protease [Desulfosporosinus nitroreducens]